MPCRFCRILYDHSCARRLYNLCMNITTQYIPREYLALKINYCRQQLERLPEVTRTKRRVRGAIRDVYVVNDHPYSLESKTGKYLLQTEQQREEILCKLSDLEGRWYSSFRGEPPADIKPVPVRRRYLNPAEESVFIGRKFFDSLKHDSNIYYPEHKTVYYNDTLYRSAAEANIARFYTENGIPFKYEPEIWLLGMKNAIYPDFVILIEELDLCKFHEHFGLKNSADYSRKTSTTYNNYSGAGLLPELDVYYTYDVDNMPFDTRSLATKLNSAVYDSLLGVNIPLSDSV